MKYITSLALILFTFTTWGQHPHTEHGFILLGTKQLHAYHLAKFNSPHEFQAIFEVKLLDSNGQTVDIEELKRLHHVKFFSLLSSDHFLITDLVSERPLKRIRVKLFKGYLRDRNTRELLLDDLYLSINKIHFFKKISKTDPRLSRKQMIVVCDSETNEYYATHIVSGSNGASTFEEIAITSPYFIGAAGEDSQSEVLSCLQVNGKTMEVRGHQVKPFSEYYYLVAIFKQLGSWSFFINHILILDQVSVN